jgi:Protein of unknown function (DUF3300)
VRGKTISILPAEPQLVCVPIYNPAVYGQWPYPAYPPQYFPVPVGFAYPPGFWIGFRTADRAGGVWSDMGLRLVRLGVPSVTFRDVYAQAATGKGVSRSFPHSTRIRDRSGSVSLAVRSGSTEMTSALHCQEITIRQTRSATFLSLGPSLARSGTKSASAPRVGNIDLGGAPAHRDAKVGVPKILQKMPPKATRNRSMIDHVTT